MNERVLVAESNVLLSEMLQTTLTSMGFTVVGATSVPADIPPLVREKRPDLLLLDFDLMENGFSGLRPFRELKKEFTEMKILVLAYYEEDDGFGPRIIREGFDGYFNKWRTPSVLSMVVDRLFPHPPRSR